MLHYLLDRFEEGVESPIAYPDHDGFASITDADRLASEIAAAAACGGVEAVKGKGRRAGELRFVRLADATRLYGHLSRTPSSRLSDMALAAVLGGAAVSETLASVAASVAETWKRNRRWAGLAPNDSESLRKALLLAEAIHEGRHAGSDYRTFSRRTAADSKALENLEAAVVRILREAGMELPQSATPREALATLGLEKVSPPLLMSGPVTLGGGAVPQGLFFVGTSAVDIGQVGLSRQPGYVLSIENYTSFVRHVTEADPARTGLTLFTGGYPSAGIQRAFSEIGRMVAPDVPFYHWSDIDPDGVWIFLTVEKAFGRPVRPHLMDPELAMRSGHVPFVERSRLPRTDNEHAAAIASYLADGSALHLEQEELDPCLP